MEYLIGVIVALLGGVFYFKKKADDAAVESKLAETKGRDKELEITQKELEESIKEIDENIDKMKEELKSKKEENKDLSLAELRDKIRGKR